MQPFHKINKMGYINEITYYLTNQCLYSDSQDLRSILNNEHTHISSSNFSRLEQPRIVATVEQNQRNIKLHSTALSL